MNGTGMAASDNCSVRSSSPEDAMDGNGATKRRKLSAQDFVTENESIELESDNHKDSAEEDGTSTTQPAEKWSLELRPPEDRMKEIECLLAKHSAKANNGSGSEAFKLESLLVAKRKAREDLDIDRRWCEAVVSAQHIAITLGSQIYILAADCQTHEAVINHSQAIHATALSGDSSFVAFGDAAGTLFIIHIETRRAVFSQNIQDTQPTKGSSQTLGISALEFAISDADGLREELVAVSASGAAVRFGNIKLRELSRAIAEGNMKLASSVREQVMVEQFQLQAKGAMVHGDNVAGLAVHAHGNAQVLVAGNGSASLSCWQNAGGSTKLVDAVSAECAGGEYVRIRLTADGRYLVALSTSGTLDIYERATLTLVFRYTACEVEDFTLTDGPQGCNVQAAVMVAAIVQNYPDDDSENGQRQLMLIALPSMEVLWARNTAELSWLAYAAGSQVVLVEGIDGPDGQQLVLRQLAETAPVDRVYKLLRSGEFTKAQAAAAEGNVSLPAVYRQLAEELIQQAQDLRLEDDSSLAEQVRELADHADPPLAVDLCVRMLLPSASGIHQLLKQGRRRAGSDIDLARRVADIQRRLGTWCTISTSEPFDVRGWAAFCTADLAAYVREFSAKGDVARVSAIWRRHAQDSRLRSDIAGAVQGFPIDVDTQSLALWLRAEVLPTLTDAQQWQAVAAWAERRARVLEERLQRVADALRLVELTDPSLWIGAVPRGMREADESQGCAALRKQLQDIDHLRMHCRLELSLDEYAQMPHVAIVAALLDRVSAPELLESAYVEHVMPYAQRHGLDTAQLTADYCIDAMTTSERGTTWQPRVLRLLSSLHAAIENKQMPGVASRTAQARAIGTVALELMRRSVVPWTEAIEEAAQHAVAVLERYAGADAEVGQAASEAQEQLRLMRLRRMLRTHGLPDEHISDARAAQGLVQWLVRQQGDVMTDVLQVVDAFHTLSCTDAYAQRLQVLCEMGDADGAAALIADIDAREDKARRCVAMEAARRALWWVRDALDSMAFSAADARMQFRQLAEAAAAVVRALTALPVRSTWVSGEAERLHAFAERESRTLGAVWQLLADAGVMVSPGELEQPTARSQILGDLLQRQWLDELVESNSQRETTALPVLPGRVRSLATMLGFGTSQLGAAVVTQCVDMRLFTMALDMCQQMVEAISSDSQDTLDCTLQALATCERGVSRFLLEIATESASAQLRPLHGTFVRQLTRLCQAAARKCTTQQQHLARLLDAHACWSLARSVFDQTADGDFAVLTRPTAVSAIPIAAGSSRDVQALADTQPDVSTQWLNGLYADMYTERGLVIDTAPAMHLVYRLIAALLRLPHAQLNGCDDFEGEHPAAESSSSSAAAGKAAAGKAAAPSVENEQCDEDALGFEDPEQVRAVVVQRCGALVALLTRNRHWVLAVQTFELTVSYLARASFVVPGDALSVNSGEDVALLRQRLAAGGVNAAEAAAMLGADTDVSVLLGSSLGRALQQPGLDAPFVYACMLSAPPARAYQQLSAAMSRAGLQPARVAALAGIGAACSRVWQQQALLDRCRAVAAAAQWSELLQLLQLDFDVARLSDATPEQLEPLVRPMLARSGLDIASVLEFAEAFRLNTTSVIVEYISLCCCSQRVDAYQPRVLAVVDEVGNSKLLDRVFKDALDSAISAYDYDRLSFVVQRLLLLHPQDAALERRAAVLDVLCAYDRRSSPTVDELRSENTRTRPAREALQETYGDSEQDAAAIGNDASLSDLLAATPLAARHLPFHTLVGAAPWAVLLPELGPETVDLLLPLAQPLGLSEDDFYTHAVKAMLCKWSESSDATTVSDLHEAALNKNHTRFDTIQPLIRCFKDPEAAVSTLQHAAESFPCGPDRVAALKMGIKLLRKWGQFIKRMPDPEREQLMSKAESIYMHFEKSYANAAIEITLRKYRLEKYLPKFVDVNDSSSAVSALASVLEGECAAESHCFEWEDREPLHEILRTLAATYDIELATLLQTLLSQYLELPVELSERSVDLQLPSARYADSATFAQSNEAAIRLRITYILGHLSDAVPRLLSFAYASKSAVSCLCRARALEILLSLSTDAEIAEQQRPEDVRCYLQALLYLADFEFVGIPQTISEFLDCEKPALARSIWVEHHQNPNAVQLVCRMCLDYDIVDRDLFLRMLPSLLAAQLFRFAIKLLKKVCELPCYADLEDLAQFWNQALAGYLLQISLSSDSSHISTVLSVLKACLGMPDLLCVDSFAIVSSLLENSGQSTDNLSLRLACIVVDVLPYSQQASAALRAVVTGMDPKALGQLVQQLLELSSSESLCGSVGLAVDWKLSRSLSMIFDHVDACGLYEQCLLCLPLRKALYVYVQNRIFNDKLLAAVRMCMERGKRQLAEQLVAKYYSVRAVDVLAQDALNVGVSLDEVTESDQTMDLTVGSKTIDISIAARKRVLRIPDSLKLDIYMRSHK
ncbi:hypothetical protein EV183_001547 [Coemansia sp. RSA 2336]|nr:hypothetical protein EV183_001547 [Coemansia sp. RSA 2336]